MRIFLVILKIASFGQMPRTNHPTKMGICFSVSVQVTLEQSEIHCSCDRRGCFLRSVDRNGAQFMAKNHERNEWPSF